MSNILRREISQWQRVRFSAGRSWTVEPELQQNEVALATRLFRSVAIAMFPDKGDSRHTVDDYSRIVNDVVHLNQVVTMG